MVSKEVIDWYSWIWTTHRNEYFLVGDDGHYAIVRMNKNSWGSLIIENNEVYFGVCERMQQEGIPVITSQEWSRLNQLRRERYIEKESLGEEKYHKQSQWSKLRRFIASVLKR